MGYMWQQGAPFFPRNKFQRTLFICKKFWTFFVQASNCTCKYTRNIVDYDFSFLRAEYFQTITKVVQLLTPSNWTFLKNSFIFSFF